MSDSFDPAAGDPVAYHLHLVSDSTGETLSAMAKAACAQFEQTVPIEHVYALVRSRRQLERVIQEISESPGIVMFTLVNPELRQELEARCRELHVPCIAVLDPVLNVLAPYLGVKQTGKPGGQHGLDAQYYRRIEAMNYAMAHDDGQGLEELQRADIVLVGVSRTSKTPTCIYLANRGYKAANIPLVPGMPAPAVLDQLTNPMIVGLIASPERLVQIRRNRLLALRQSDETEYADPDAVQQEITAARRLFAERGWPVIDVTRRSIEETAAAIINLVQRKGAT